MSKRVIDRDCGFSPENYHHLRVADVIKTDPKPEEAKKEKGKGEAEAAEETRKAAIQLNNIRNGCPKMAHCCINSGR